MKRLWLLFSLLVLAIPALAAAQAVDVHQLAEAVDRRYNRLQSLQADFTEIYQGAGLNRTESGTLWLKRPGKMRWEYRQPRAKLFLTNGKTAWFYVPGEQQARRAPIKKLEDLRSPLRYLLGKTKLEKEFEGLSLAPDVAPLAPGDVVLRGVPKGQGERITQVLLEITPGKEINRIVIEEADGSRTEFRFRDQQENVQISEQLFQFTPPPGVEIVEMTEGMTG
jgi:outer membrane lipoprotein carrier protein